MMNVLTVALFTVSLCCAQQLYRLRPLVETRRVQAFGRLSENGSAIGSYSSNSEPAVFSPELGVTLPRGTIDGSVRSINAINASGDIVGQMRSQRYCCGYQPFLSRPPYDTLIDLSPILGWNYGSANDINDRGDIVANGGIGADASNGYVSKPFVFDDWFPGLGITRVERINNLGQVIAVSCDDPSCYMARYYLYSPAAGVTVLPATPHGLNNKGDVMFGADGAQFIQTAVAQIPLPSAYSWVSFNDHNEAVGSIYMLSSASNEFTYIPAYFSAGTGLIDLSTRILNLGDERDIVPAAINNRGQIAVNYHHSMLPFYEGVGLLEPVPDAATAPSAKLAGHTSSFRTLSNPVRRVYNVNGARVKTVR